MRRLAALGVTHYHGSVPDAASVKRIELLGQQVIPVVAALTTGPSSQRCRVRGYPWSWPRRVTPG